MELVDEIEMSLIVDSNRRVDRMQDWLCDWHKQSEFNIYSVLIQFGSTQVWNIEFILEFVTLFAFYGNLCLP